MDVQIDHDRRTIRPASREGDDHFGLAIGSNGTGPMMRRTLITPPGYDWRRFDGRPAIGVTLQPGAGEAAGLGEARNPWDGPGLES